MAECLFTPHAEQDLREIWNYIAAENERAADALLMRTLEKAQLAAHHPLMGAPRPELSPTARLLFEGSYITLYEPIADGILVVAIVHGSRDSESWLGRSHDQAGPR